MFKMCALLGLVLSFFSSFVLADDVSCPETKIHNVQIEKYKVLIGVDGGISRNIGMTNSANIEQTKMNFAVALTAQATGKKVITRYPAEYDCSKTNYGIQPIMIRIKN